jgi:hypothetical protein
MSTSESSLSVEERLAVVEEQARAGARAKDRGEIENLFSTYMYLHNAFRDEEIFPLWVKPGTPGIRAQYSNVGVYTTWESVTEYHRDRVGADYSVLTVGLFGEQRLRARTILRGSR